MSASAMTYSPTRPVHGGGDERSVERDVAGQLGQGAHLNGYHLAVGGDQQDTVESKGIR